MRRLIPCIAAVVSIAGLSIAEAQESPLPGPAPGAEALFANAVLLASAGLQQQQKQPPPPPPPPPALPAERPIRMGSMVGYVEDAVIASKIRVRFDMAAETRVPDRAEFFYAKCGCYRDLELENPAAFDPDAPGPRPGAANDLNFQQLYLWGEYAFGDRASVFGNVPVRWIQPQSFLPGTGPGFQDQSGLSDIRAGAKFGLAASDDRSVTAQVQVQFPTGEAERGMGTAHTSLEPVLLYLQRLGEVVAVESQLGIWLPFEGSAPVPTQAEGEFAGDILFYGIGPSFSVYNTNRVQVAPVVEIVGWRVLNGYQTATVGDASGTNIVNLKVGVRAAFPAGSVYIGAGKALTDATWYDDVLRIEYRYTF